MDYNIFIKNPKLLIGLRFKATNVNFYYKITEIKEIDSHMCVCFIPINKETHKKENQSYDLLDTFLYNLYDKTDKTEIFKTDYLKILRQDKIKRLIKWMK